MTDGPDPDPDLEPEDPGSESTNEIHGGVFFDMVVQGRTITLQLPPRITPALSGLPVASRAFTGREGQVRELLAALDPREAGQPARVAVAGLAGVGKTELVVQVAARALREPDWFPGGVLFVDLLGYSASRRVSPERALDGMLRALGIPEEHVPADLQSRSRTYRSVLDAFARQGRRILVVVDNASAEEQAEPLLPSDGTTATLLTSRHTLAVGGSLHDLGVLQQQESVDLLGTSLELARGASDQRVRDEPGAAAAIAGLCGGLPLALCIAAALLADTPTRPLASLAGALEAAHTRLRHLRREDRAVQAAFDLSYERLGGEQARLFRLLPLDPGPDVSTWAATQLIDLDTYATEVLLLDLARAHLIEPGRKYGRWRMHDLVRLYADERGRGRAEEDDRRTAYANLMEYYLRTAHAADRLLAHQPVRGPSPLRDRGHAVQWLEAERPNLVAAALTDPEAVVVLAFVLAKFFEMRGYLDDWLAVSERAATVYRSRGDRDGEAAAISNLGFAQRHARRFDDAIASHTRARAIFRELGDRRGEASASNRLGTSLVEVGRVDEAITAHAMAAAVLGALGDRGNEAAAIGNLGSALRVAGRLEEAVMTLERAVKAFRALGDLTETSSALMNLGSALQQAGRPEEAIDHISAAAAVFRKLGDHRREALAMVNLGGTLQVAGRPQDSIAPLRQAAGALHDIGDRHGEAAALTNLGLSLHQADRSEESIGPFTQAAALFRDLGDPANESRAVANLGFVLCRADRVDEAIAPLARTADLFRQLGERHDEAMALANLAVALHALGRVADALGPLSRSAEVFGELGAADDEAQVRATLAALRQEGDA